MGGDPYWSCGKCGKWTYIKKSKTACFHCEAPPSGSTAKWLKEPASAAPTKPDVPKAVGSGGSKPAQVWGTDWQNVPRSKKNARRAKNRAAKAAESGDVEPAIAAAVASTSDEDVVMDLTDGDPAGSDEGVAKLLADKIAHITQLDACTFELPNALELRAKLVAERDELKARVEAAKSPLSRVRAARKLADKAKAALEKAESSFTASKLRMAKAVADESALQEKHGADMRAAELLVAEHEGAWAEASQQMADKAAKLAKVPVVTVPLAVCVLPTPSGDDKELCAIVLKMAAAIEARNLEHQQQQREYDAIMQGRIEAAIAASSSAAAASGPVQDPASPTLQPSATEVAKTSGKGSAGRASPYGAGG
jgi:hypothetical protein